jgi:hypothetical protein
LGINGDKTIMTSILKVDAIYDTAGNMLFENGYSKRPGTIIECITGICDGNSVTALSNTYTLQNVTTTQTVTNAYADVTGSSITYTPPEGTTKVVYRFTFGYFWQTTAHSIQHFKFFIDSDEVVYARHNRSATYLEQRNTFEWVIPIGGSTNNNTGRQATWTTPKTLKMQTRRYATGSNGGNLHGTTYWDGAGGSQFNIPLLTVMAIA